MIKGAKLVVIQDGPHAVGWTHADELFLQKYRPGASFSIEAVQMLEHYCWPGNVCELRNAVISASLNSSSDKIGAESLPEELRSAESSSGLRNMAAVVQSESDASETADGRGMLDELEKSSILRVLPETDGHRERFIAFS